MLIHAARHTTNNNSNNNNSINNKYPKISTNAQNVQNSAIMTPKTNIPSNSPINVPNTSKTAKTNNSNSVTTTSVLQPPVFTSSSITDLYTIESSVLARGRFARVKLCTPKSVGELHSEKQQYCVKIVSKRNTVS